EQAGAFGEGVSHEDDAVAFFELEFVLRLDADVEAERRSVGIEWGIRIERLAADWWTNLGAADECKDREQAKRRGDEARVGFHGCIHGFGEFVNGIDCKRKNE